MLLDVVNSHLNSWIPNDELARNQKELTALSDIKTTTKTQKINFGQKRKTLKRKVAANRTNLQLAENMPRTWECKKG
jgi:hypothetical protein